MSEQYVSPKKASEIIGVHWMTLKNWEKQGKIECIRTPGGKRMYNVNKYLIVNKGSKPENIPMTTQQRKNICYCRVSTRNQSDDLERQIKYMKESYPTYEIVSEIGSGLNLNRLKLVNIIKMAINGEINEIVVAHKDRLARFGFDLIEMLVKEYSGGKITVIDKTEMSPEEEITKDLVSIINVFSARINGLRKYKTMIKDDK
jgi:predicted site-specific integrase-resolvase